MSHSAKKLLLIVLGSLSLLSISGGAKANSDQLLGNNIPAKHMDGRIIATLRSMGECWDVSGGVFDGSYKCPIYDESGNLRGEVDADPTTLEFLIDGGYLRISSLGLTPEFLNVSETHPPVAMEMDEIHSDMIPEAYNNPNYQVLTFMGRAGHLKSTPDYVGKGTLRDVNTLEFRCVFIVEKATWKVIASLNRIYVMS